MMKIPDILERSASRFGHNPCAAIGSTAPRVLTYESAWQVLLQHQAWLMSLIGSPPNCEIILAYLSGNSIDFLLSMLACMSFENKNISVALLNTRWTPLEIAAALQTTNPTDKTIILYGSGFEETARNASSLLSHDASTLAIPLFSESRMMRLTTLPDSSDTTNNISDEEIDIIIQQISDSEKGEQDAIIVFTSGTTSGSKGVRLSHKALYVQALAKLRQPCGYSNKTRMLASTVPLFHVGGLCSTLSVLLAGGTWVLPSSTLSSGFDPVSVLKSVSSPILPVNTLVVVPAMLHSIIEQVPIGCSYDSVRLLLIGGQSASPETLRHVNRVFPNARIVQTFACTEAASSLTFLEVQSHQLDKMTISLPEGDYSGDCVGVPPAHVQLILVDKDENDSVVKQPYQIGVFATRGPHVMNGYWKLGVSNPSSNMRDSWYLTSDLGFRDEQGQFYFCGRTKDIIRTGGESVIALEVERVLLRHPDVRECAVFALPDKRFGEAVCVAIVCNNEETLSLSGIRAFCTKQGLAGYKKPRAVSFMEELPRNSSGKVLKHILVERFRREQELLQSKL